MRVRARLVLLATAAALVSAPAVDGSRVRARPDTGDSTFYDFTIDRTLASEPSSIFATERAALRALSEADVDAFDWSNMGKDPAWFDEIQTLRFLLPWLASSSHEPQARQWLMNWYLRYCLDETGRPAWGSALACAQRTLVLAYWLKREERRGAAADEAVVPMLRDALLMHQRYLAADQNFDGTRNVGVLQAIALRETTHSAPSTEVAQLATRRLLSTLDVILSPQGTGLEHSAQYHFVVLAWLEAALAMVERDGEDAAQKALRAHAVLMRRAGYFLLDPAMRVVQIGDSDSTVVTAFSGGGDFGAPGVVFFDSLAGYAVYKAPPASADGRYVAYRIQRGAIALPAHCHADAMSLVAVWNGETILGDSGRYRYGADGTYFASPAAHNTIFPESFLRPTPGRLLSSVVCAGRRRTAEGVAWWARMDWHGVEAGRGVSIPAATQAVIVDDTLRSHGSGASSARFCWTWNAGNDVRAVTLESKGPNSVVWLVETHRLQRFRFHMTVSGDAGGAEVELLRGATDPELGWSSPAYGVKRPSWVVLARYRPGPVLTVRTVIEPAH